MNVAFLGTGLMGLPMGRRVLEAGHSLVAFNRTREKAIPLESAGATIADSPKDAVESADVCILMLTDAAAIREVLFELAPPPSLSGRTVIQMGTISPVQSIEIMQSAIAAGAEYIESPVLGSIPEAREGKLILMVGASEEQFARWSELLRCFGPDPLLIGSVGKAATLKLAMNQLIASLTAGFSLSLGLVQRGG
ncbi:MAG: NAD(P)-dependent oxidoreductase, partial [Planctomycetota bacterium]